MRNYTRTTLNIKHLLMELDGHEGQECVTIYSPVAVEPSQRRMNSVRLSNLIRQAREQLGEEADEILAPAEGLVEDQVFWDGTDCSTVCLFLGRDFARRLETRMEVPESVSVNGGFDVKPLLTLLPENNPAFYILALSQKEARLFRGDRYDVTPIELPVETPDGVEEVSRFERDAGMSRDQNLAHRAGSRDQGPHTVRGAGKYHGQGINNYNALTRDWRARFLRAVGQAVDSVIQSETLPVVLAGVEFLAEEYRRIATSQSIFDQEIPGNPEILSAQELHQAAWPIAREQLENERQERLSRVEDLLGTGQTSVEPRQIVLAACDGRVDTLLVARDAELNGVCRLEEREVKLRANGTPERDLLSLAALKTVGNGGKVFSLLQERLPQQAPAAAVFRY